MDGKNDDHVDGGNPGGGLHSLNVRVSALESDVSAIKTDIKWIKMLITPTFLVTFISLLLMIARLGVI